MAVQVLRLVDGDRKPSMGFLYGELKQAKEEIKVAYKNVEANYRPILDIIDAKAQDRLDSPLHLAAYLLNPYYFFKDQSIEDDPMVMDAFIVCVEMFFPNDIQLQNLVSNVELLKYKEKVGSFRKDVAIAGCAHNDDNYNPGGWWSNYGNGVPNLKRMARRILSLTTSSSGCERNWSTFEGIRKEKGVDVLLASQASMAQAWIVDGGDDEEVEPGSGLTWGMVGEASGADSALEPRRSCRNVEVRELHEEDFQSDQETEDEGNEEYEFESDEERVLEGYGEEELET
ncbi:hypothetical protein Acr_00g0013980 [Actinidia rufa]|uniref:HAT C-terminal dimerisation domain-containing protein n=1 Tax=Actinidia rufa TaxID=165716 RepID=A0A7J0DAA9_9ERIC|nr:hypothetical protein Acr_00g0013980 [Actinidia rufa]